MQTSPAVEQIKTLEGLFDCILYFIVCCVRKR